MKVHLERTITDHVARRRYNLYRRKDGKYWVLATPSDPGLATADNVNEFVLDTRQEALMLCVGTRP